jgi:hypothetical protein
VVYLLLGPGFLVATAMALIQASADYEIVHASIPGAWALVAGYVAIAAVNVALWIWGYRLFNRDSIAPSLQVFTACVPACLCIVFIAYCVDQQYNKINLSHLDLRRPAAYRVENPEAIKHLSAGLLEKIGPDLRARLSDPQFEHALRSRTFYKQNFDEAFQLLDHAVMFGYRKDASRFEIIRFPQELAAELRFELVGEEL